MWGVGGGFGFGRAGEGRVYWYCFEAVREGAAAPERPREAFLERYGSWFEPIPALIASTDEAAIEPTFTYDRRPRRTWGRGRVTLLGDAAHPMKPNIGQGAAQALEDAVVLGACLRGARDPEAALREYERRRVRRANAVVRASRQAGRAAEVRSPFAARMRDPAFKALPNRNQICGRRLASHAFCGYYLARGKATISRRWWLATSRSLTGDGWSTLSSTSSSGSSLRCSSSARGPPARQPRSAVAPKPSDFEPK